MLLCLVNFPVESCDARTRFLPYAWSQENGHLNCPVLLYYGYYDYTELNQINYYHVCIFRLNFPEEKLSWDVIFYFYYFSDDDAGWGKAATFQWPTSEWHAYSQIYIAPVKYDKAKIVRSISLFHGQINPAKASHAKPLLQRCLLESNRLYCERSDRVHTISKGEEKNDVLLLESKIKPVASLHDGRGAWPVTTKSYCRLETDERTLAWRL